MKTELEPISLSESAELVRLEGVIERGLGTFVEVGEALAEIRDLRLYRIEYAKFDDYLAAKWKMSRSKAARLISGAETVRLLPIGNSPPPEAVVRPLAAIPMEQRAEAWKSAVNESPTGRPTASIVAAVVESIKPQRQRHASRDALDDSETPLQTCTRNYALLNVAERQQFRNFQRGLDGGT